MSKPIKPRRMWRSIKSGLVYPRTHIGHIRTETVPVLVIDLSPESVEALVEKIYAEWRRGPVIHRDAIAAIKADLAAIGIKARGRK